MTARMIESIIYGKCGTCAGPLRLVVGLNRLGLLTTAVMCRDSDGEHHVRRLPAKSWEDRVPV